MKYDINPGLDSVFPWLSQIAPAFQQYKWRGLVFSYKSTSADLVSTTNTSLGSVIMTTDYNAVNPETLSKREMLNYEFTSTCKPSCSFLHMIECERKQTYDNDLFFTRSGTPPHNADKRLYDIGSFYIATEGMQGSTGQIGELWCSYEIEFLKPKFAISNGVESEIGYFDYPSCVAGTNFVFFGDPDKASIFGNIGLTYTNVAGTSNGKITFPVDSGGKAYIIHVWFFSSGVGTSTSPQLVITKNQIVSLQQSNAMADAATWDDSVNDGYFIPSTVSTFGGTTPNTGATTFNYSYAFKVNDYNFNDVPWLLFTPSLRPKASYPDPLAGQPWMIFVTEISESAFSATD
jgi:hypothetical protein